jgi:mycothiol system anti-sigma-R factor
MADSAPEKSPVECKNVWQKWTGFLDKELSPEESARVQKHLDECNHCREFVDTQSQFNRLLRKSLIEDAQEMPEVLRVKVLSLLERKGYGQLSAEEEEANKVSVMDPVHARPAAHGHDHPSKASGQAGEPGHVHDHDHGHSHSHGPSPATRAALAVLIVGVVLLLFMFVSQRKKTDDMSEKVATLEKQVSETQAKTKELDELRVQLRDAKGEAQLARNERDEERDKNKDLKKKYDETVVNYDKLTRAMTALVNAGHAVMEGDAAMKPVPELEKKWRDMFPKIGDMPHKAGDMDPSLWDVTAIEGEDVLWVVFSKKGDPKSKFTLMTFTEKYMKEKYGELKGMVETVKDGTATITWQNTKDQKVYHALVSAGDLNTARAQLEALK